MEEEKNVEGQETLKTDQTVKTPDVKTEETSPYDKIIEELKEETQNKATALKIERQARKDAEKKLSELEELDKENQQKEQKDNELKMEELKKIAEETASKIVKQEIEAKITELSLKINENRVDELIARQTDDPKERQAIKLTLQKRIIPTDNLERDIQDARILVNKDILFSEGIEEGKKIKKEEILAKFSAGQRSGEKEEKNRNSVDEEAIKILRMAGVPEPEKYIK